MTIPTKGIIHPNGLNILCFSEHFLPHTGGTVTYVINICQNLTRQGHNVFLVTYTADLYNFPARTWINNGQYFIYNTGLAPSIKYDSRRARRNFIRQIGADLAQHISDIQPDLIHVLYGHYLINKLAGHIGDIPLFWTVNNVPPAEYSPIHKTRFSFVNYFLTTTYFSLVKHINRRRLSNISGTRIIAISDQVKNQLIAENVDSKIISTIPVGVDTQVFRPLQNDFIKKTQGEPFKILCIAPVSHHKGQHLLLEALRIVNEHHPNFTFTNVGQVVEPDYKILLNNFLNKNLLAEKCQFITKKLETNALVNKLVEADVYVQPSLQEGFCLSVLEAASCGTSVIGTETGAIPEIFSTIQNSNLCAPNDAECLANKILDTIKRSKPDQSNSNKQHKQIAEKYSWNAISTTLIKLYRDALGEN